MDCPPVSPGGGSEVPEALLEPGVGAGLTGSPWLLRVSRCSWHWENSSEQKVPVLMELIFHSMSETVNKEANTISQTANSVM